MSDTSPGALLALVRSGRAATRSELGRQTGLSRSAVASRVTALADAGLLLEGEELASTGGRPPGGLLFNVDAAVVLGVAVGRSRSQVGVFDLEGSEIAGGRGRPRGRRRPGQCCPTSPSSSARCSRG